MRQRLTRGAVVTLVAALAFGPLLATPASADLQSFQSRGDGYALRVTIDLSTLQAKLPADAKAQLETVWDQVRGAVSPAQVAELPADFPYVIDQFFARTTAEASSAATQAVSVLGDGLLNLGSLTANGDNPSPAGVQKDFSIPDAGPLASLINGTAGKLTASVAAGPKVDGDALIASVTASLEALAAVPTVGPALEAALDQVVAEVNSSVVDVQDTIETTATEVASTLPAEVQAALASAGVTDLASTVTGVELPTVPNPLSTEFASIKNIAGTSTAQRAGDMASADALSSIEAVDVLEGFLTAGVINLAAHAEAAGTAGSAKVASACSIADVRIGDDLGVSLDGKTLYVTGPEGEIVSVPVTDNELVQQVAAVTDLLGLDVQLCDTSQATAAADGSSATQKVSAFIVTIEPKVPAVGGDVFSALGLAPGDSIIKLVIDPTVTASAGATPATALAAPAQLPRTGAPAVATVISGAILAVGALGLRRRIR